MSDRSIFSSHPAKESLIMKVHKRLGARGWAMLLCAYIWFLLGIGAWQEQTTLIPGAFHLLIDNEVRALLWVVPSIFAMFMAWSRERSYVGLLPLVIMPGLSLASYLWSWVLTWPIATYLFGYHTGSDRGWYLASFYLALLGMVGLAAVIPPPLSDQTKSAIARSKEH